MKKNILILLVSVTLLFTAPLFTQASANDLSFKAVVYEDTVKNEYYSLGFFDYLFALKDIDVSQNSMTHLQFTNDSYYKFFDYLFGINGAPDFQAGLRNVVEKYPAQNLNIVPGKVENGIVISAEEPVPTEFKVISIK